MQQADINPALSAITSSLFRVSAKLLVMQNRRLLVVQEEQGWWGLPGGGIDHGESIAEGLAREISEEIGFRIDPSAISSFPILVDTTAVFDGIPRLTLFYQQATNAPQFEPEHLELVYKWANANEFRSLPLAPNITPMRDAILQKMAA